MPGSGAVAGLRLTAIAKFARGESVDARLASVDGVGAEVSVREAAEAVSHRCYTSLMPTARRRHAITETAPVQAALDELRAELDGARLELAELVVLGAREKVAQLRASRGEQRALRRRLAQRVRDRLLPVDPDAAEDVRRNG